VSKTPCVNRMQVDLSLHPFGVCLSTAKMTLRIEKSSEGNTTTIRLIGRVRAEHLHELNAQIKNSEPYVALDLGEVSLVDVDVVRFLGACQRRASSLPVARPIYATGSP
jgi:hypothetical protein